MLPQCSAMGVSLRRRRRAVPLAVLLCGLVLLTFAQRRLAELDFDSTGVVRIENNDKLDGDEIYIRLVFVNDTAVPRAPEAGVASHAGLVSLEACSLGLVTLRPSEPRAPPYALPACA